MVEEITLYKNNDITIALRKNTESQKYTKQINIQYYYIQELIDQEKFMIKQISDSKMLANGMTKALLTQMLKKH